MSIVVRILLSCLIGAIVCGALCSLMFFILTLSDNQKTGEAFAFSLIVGFIGAFLGLVIGLTIGAGNLGWIGGGIVGFLLTLIIVGIYVFSTADNASQYIYFLSESRIIFIVLTLPTILTGVITGLVKNLIHKP